MRFLSIETEKDEGWLRVGSMYTTVLKRFQPRCSTVLVYAVLYTPYTAACGVYGYIGCRHVPGDFYTRAFFFFFENYAHIPCFVL